MVSARALAGLLLTVGGVTLAAIHPANIVSSNQTQTTDGGTDDLPPKPEPEPVVEKQERAKGPKQQIVFDVAAGARLRKGYAMAFLSMLMDVAGSVFTKTSAVGLSPFDINAVRFGSASVSLALWQLYCRRVGSGGGEGGSSGDGGDGGSMGLGSWLKVGLGVLFCTCLAPTFNNIVRASPCIHRVRRCRRASGDNVHARRRFSGYH